VRDAAVDAPFEEHARHVGGEDAIPHAGEIDRYVASNEWQGKAGGYGIQDKDPFVVRQSGSHTNIVGLPMSAARQLLEEAGIKPTRR
jgi:predicted house-cleaning NTP pyrophosphatase (Maf/HAM1 superfamily)